MCIRDRSINIHRGCGGYDEREDSREFLNLGFCDTSRKVGYNQQVSNEGLGKQAHGDGKNIGGGDSGEFFRQGFGDAKLSVRRNKQIHDEDHRDRESQVEIGKWDGENIGGGAEITEKLTKDQHRKF